MPSPESLGKPRFTLASVAALYSDSFAPGFSNAERHAAACALLRHESHQDGTHYHTETPGSLHPSFIKFNEILMLQDQKMITHEEFVEAALENIFDVVHLFFKLGLYDFQCSMYCSFVCKTVWMAESHFSFAALGLRQQTV
jgi:hypothetical protein